MSIATRAVVEYSGKSVTVKLKQPMSAMEVWRHFVERGCKPEIILLSGNTAWVNLPEKPVGKLAL